MFAFSSGHHYFGMVAIIKQFILDKRMSEDESRCCDKCPLVMRIFNITSALLLIGFGIAGIVVMTVNNLTSAKFFLLFSPIFMILVGFLFIAAEFKLQTIIKHFVFMKSLFGRGVFNMFMASSVFYYFSCGNDNNVAAWIAAILIFLTGIVYCVLGCCFSSKFESKEEQDKKEDLIQ